MSEQRIIPEEAPPDAEDPDAEDVDPWFREETRVPETGPPYPDWARDPLTPQLIDTARDLLFWAVRGVWGPASYALQRQIWQLRKFELLDWLRPLELLLRRMLLIEAFALAGSQTLPQARKATGKSAAAPKSDAAQSASTFDPARPDTWRVAFTALPARKRSGPHRRLPPVQPDREFRQKILAKRHRRRLVSALPLARRLEAAIRVINNPLPYVRRLAFRLRRGRTASATRLVIPRSRRFRFATDALDLSGNRAAHMAGAFWGSG